MKVLNNDKEHGKSQVGNSEKTTVINQKREKKFSIFLKQI